MTPVTDPLVIFTFLILALLVYSVLWELNKFLTAKAQLTRLQVDELIHKRQKERW